MTPLTKMKVPSAAGDAVTDEGPVVGYRDDDPPPNPGSQAAAPPHAPHNLSLASTTTLALQPLPVDIAAQHPFIIQSSNPEDAASGLFRLIEGEAKGMHVHGALDPTYCLDIHARFATSPHVKARRDGVPGYEFGVTTFGKPPQLLADLAYNHEGELRGLLGGPDNYVTRLLRSAACIGAALGYTVRPAVYRGQPMQPLRAVQWTKSSAQPSKWLLRPHDDLAQVQACLNEDFEIRKAVRVFALNIYVASKKGSGQLKAWRWAPTDADRARLGVTETGYPYEEDSIPPGTEEWTFDQETGDAVWLDGSCLHGVLVGRDELPGRLIINGFAALLEDRRTIVLFA